MCARRALHRRSAGPAPGCAPGEHSIEGAPAQAPIRVDLGRTDDGSPTQRTMSRLTQLSFDAALAERTSSGGPPMCGRPCALTARTGATALPIDREVEAVAPFGPAAVVDGDVLVAQQRHCEGELRGGDPGPVVADHPAPARDVCLEQDVAELVADPEVLASRSRHRPDGHVRGARDMPEALRVALEPAVLGRSPRVEEEHVG